MEKHLKYNDPKHANRRGKIALVALVFLLVIVVLMAFVGNTGHAVKQKMDVQNASDTIAFSGALWMARGMNTITLNNHLVGEATAIGVIHDAIGGPEHRLGLTDNSPENRAADSVIKATSPLSPISRIPSVYIPPPITEVDRRIIDFVTKRTSPVSNAEMRAFAMLYDARLTLKRELAVWLSAKAFANLGYLIPPPFGYPTAIAATITHVLGTAQIVLIGKEWLLLEVVEAYAKLASPLQETVFTDQLIPVLATFAAEIAGLDPDSPAEPPRGGLAVEQIDEMLDRMKESLDVASQIVPKEEDRKLPVVFEPPPSMQGRQGAWPTGWKSDENPIPPDASDKLQDIKDSIDDAINDLDDEIGELEDAIADLDPIRDAIQEKMDSADLADSVVDMYEQELENVSEQIETLRQKADELRESRTEVERQRTELESLPQLDVASESQNLSLRNIPDAMDPEQERLTQWVRATMPNVDAIRAPILGTLRQHCPKSEAAKHYEKWTNRYALIRAWKMRSGMRLRKTGTKTATWEKQSDPYRLPVMIDSFEGDRSNKGNEPWTKSVETGKQQAEQSFTLLVVANRDYESLMANSVLRSGQSNGMTMFSQSIVYNANRQTNTNGSQQQPLVGWDTLNWDTDVSTVPEWGAEASAESSRWPWQWFSSLEYAPKVKLNWQAKLVPVTAGRLELASEELEGDEQKAADFALEHVDLISH